MRAERAGRAPSTAGQHELCRQPDSLTGWSSRPGWLLHRGGQVGWGGVRSPRSPLTFAAGGGGAAAGHEHLHPQPRHGALNLHRVGACTAAPPPSPPHPRSPLQPAPACHGSWAGPAWVLCVGWGGGGLWGGAFARGRFAVHDVHAAINEHAGRAPSRKTRLTELCAAVVRRGRHWCASADARGQAEQTRRNEAMRAAGGCGRGSARGRGGG